MDILIPTLMSVAVPDTLSDSQVILSTSITGNEKLDRLDYSFKDQFHLHSQLLGLLPASGKRAANRISVHQMS
jgi:hypothetical protein